MAMVYEHLKNPEVLEYRPEGLYLIYPGDRVIVKSNQFRKEELSGQVTEIVHGSDSMSNIEHLFCTIDVGEKKLIQTGLNEVDLEQRNLNSAFILRSNKLIYIDDIVQVNNSSHSKYGSIGIVRAIIYSEDGREMYEARNKSFFVPESDDIKEDIKYENIIIPKEIQDLFNSGKITRGFYEYIFMKQKFEKELSNASRRKGFPARLLKLNEDSQFTFYAEEVELVELFPLNRLFKIDQR